MLDFDDMVVRQLIVVKCLRPQEFKSVWRITFGWYFRCNWIRVSDLSSLDFYFALLLVLNQDVIWKFVYFQESLLWLENLVALLLYFFVSASLILIHLFAQMRLLVTYNFWFFCLLAKRYVVYVNFIFYFGNRRVLLFLIFYLALILKMVLEMLFLILYKFLLFIVLFFLPEIFKLIIFVVWKIRQLISKELIFVLIFRGSKRVINLLVLRI